MILIFNCYVILIGKGKCFYFRWFDVLIMNGLKIVSVFNEYLKFLRDENC